MNNDFLSSLNLAQREAVEYCDGPSLVIAGAGSGKTRVLTYKIAHLINQGMAPWKILALTFTNKAANEMKERIDGLVGGGMSSALWMGTFHSIFNRILRQESSVFGFTPNYTIYQPSDSQSLVKNIIKDLGLDIKKYKEKNVCERISEAKNALILPSEYAQDRDIIANDTYNGLSQLSIIYSQYFNRMHQANAMDFDDLLLYTFILFEKYPEIRRKYADKFDYVLVDEYQDTNFAQHQILAQLTKEKQKICVVGDDAQSIYSFRGAKIDNILKFQSQYDGARLFKLEQNYRSTQTIVEAANSIITHNKRQIPKHLFSENEEGEKIGLSVAYSDIEEGEIVCNRITDISKKENIGYNSFAILYRTNSQSRIFEEALRRRSIPYRIYGGRSFYDQKIIRDALAYMRLIVNNNDEEALRRIINYPARGIGKTTIDKIQQEAVTREIPMWKIIEAPHLYSLSLSAGTMTKMSSFHNMIASYSERANRENAAILCIDLMKESGLIAEITKDNTIESRDKYNNIEELLNAVNAFVDTQRESGNENNIYLVDYLNNVSLLSGMDNEDDADEEEDVKERVTLLTVHSAKGLEFDVVFIVGMEDMLFPNIMAMSSPKEIEEERRLFYVAVTRARKRCFLSRSKSRYHNGKTETFEPSRFIKEIDSKYISTGSHTTNVNNPMLHFINKINIRLNNNKAENMDIEKLKPLEIDKKKSTKLMQISNNAFGTLKVGNRVSHERFGFGTISELEQVDGNFKAVVKFDNLGEKHLLLKYAKLTIVE